MVTARWCPRVKSLCDSHHSYVVRATISSLFLRFVLILQYYVLENITVLISKKCPYLWLASLLCLIFCGITILNKQYLNGAVWPGDRKIFRCAIAKKMVISQTFWMFWMLFSLAVKLSYGYETIQYKTYRPFLRRPKHFVIKVLWRHKSSTILPHRDVTHYQALLVLQAVYSAVM